MEIEVGQWWRAEPGAPKFLIMGQDLQKNRCWVTQCEDGRVARLTEQEILECELVD